MTLSKKTLFLYKHTLHFAIPFYNKTEVLKREEGYLQDTDALF